MEHVDKPLDLEITLQTKPYPQQNSGLGRFGISNLCASVVSQIHKAIADQQKEMHIFHEFPMICGQSCQLLQLRGVDLCCTEGLVGQEWDSQHGVWFSNILNVKTCYNPWQSSTNHHLSTTSTYVPIFSCFEIFIKWTASTKRGVS